MILEMILEIILEMIVEMILERILERILTQAGDKILLRAKEVMLELASDELDICTRSNRWGQGLSQNKDKLQTTTNYKQ